MNVKVHSIHFDADIKLINFIEEKLAKLDQYHDSIIASEVYLKIDKDREHGNKVAEIRLTTPGKEFFAKKQCKSFEEAADLAAEALRRQVRKKKGKLQRVYA